MKYLGFIIFFTVFFSIYTAGNYYVYSRASQAWPFSGWPKTIFSFVFFILWASFIVSRFTGNTNYFVFHHTLTWIGSFWLIAVFYFLLLVVIIDLVRLTNAWLHFLPHPNTLKYFEQKTFALSISVIVVFIIVLAGHINAIKTRVTTLELTTNKILEGNKELVIVAISDIHFGTLIGKNRLEKLTDTVNNLQPDLIVLAGDLLDEAQAPILKEDIGAPLKKLKAPLGVYAILGNHEYIGGVKTAQNYINSLGIQLLKDSIVMPDTSFYLIGRDDIQATRFSNHSRKPLDSLLKGIDKSKLLILLDHQPYYLADAEKNLIDLQISGHTHDGQFWPFNYIVASMFEISYGFYTKGNTNFYISSGYGTWGPPVRIATTPEIVKIILRSKE
jgi:uncharacterized protein